MLTLAVSATPPIACSLKACLLRFEPQLLSYRLPVSVDTLIANLIALNLNEGSPRKGKGATGRRAAIKIWTAVGSMEYPLGGDQAPTGIPATNDVEGHVGISLPHRFCIMGDGLPGKSLLARPGSAICSALSI